MARKDLGKLAQGQNCTNSTFSVLCNSAQGKALHMFREAKTLLRPSVRGQMTNCLGPDDGQARTDRLQQTTEFFFLQTCCRGLPSGWPNNERCSVKYRWKCAALIVLPQKLNWST